MALLRPANDGRTADELNSFVSYCYAGLARLDPTLPPADVPPRRWLRFLSDARSFLGSHWPLRAVELGWTALDLFGCHPVRPHARHDHSGLVWLLAGGKVVAMTANTAVIERPTGSRVTFYRRPQIDTVLPWEVWPGSVVASEASRRA